MGVNVSSIMPGVYIGSYGNASNINQLERHQITHVIAVLNLLGETHRKHTKPRVHKWINAIDLTTEPIINYFSECNDFIHEARLSDGSFLIQCGPEPFVLNMASHPSGFETPHAFTTPIDVG